MKKIKIGEAPIRYVTLQINDQDVEINTFMPFLEIVSLIHAYVDNYFYGETALKHAKSETDYLSAEYTQKLAILDKFTNIDIDSIDFGNFKESWYKRIVDKIENYEYFIELENRVVSDIKEQMLKNVQVGNVLDGAINMLKNALANVDFDKIPEQLEKAKGLLKDMEQSPVSQVFKESQSQVAIEKPVKKRVSKKEKEYVQ